LLSGGWKMRVALAPHPDDPAPTGMLLDEPSKPSRPRNLIWLEVSQELTARL